MNKNSNSNHHRHQQYQHNNTPLSQISVSILFAAAPGYRRRKKLLQYMRQEAKEVHQKKSKRKPIVMLAVYDTQQQ
jgi:hypothetical protein